MDINEIKQLVELMDSSNLTEIEIEEEALKLRIKRGSDEVQTIAMPVAQPMAAPAMPAAAAPLPAPTGTLAPASDELEGNFIKSPMVGTFYRAPSPESGTFVEIGDTVSAESVVCIIEAMKVMNEIKAEASGEIAEILVENGDPIEFGQPLFKLK